MKTLVRNGLIIGATASLAACGAAQPFVGAPGMTTQALARFAHRSRTAASPYQVLYSFGGQYIEHMPNGIAPRAGLIKVTDTFYGTTESGGSGKGGTIFSMTKAGKEDVLHSFGSGSIGRWPYASLIDVNGTLYGTTEVGSTYKFGAVFSSSKGGTAHLLHSFGSGSDGKWPFASLINVDGTLYGTTYGGGTYGNGNGSNGYGMVFSISTTGTEQVLHSFSGAPDGQTPYASLIDVDGTLYGTTYGGGKYGKGTVFSISTAGSEQVLHSFGSGSDGTEPFASLIDINGTLYGTTCGGGTSGTGTVFSISTAGEEQVLHSFGSGSDGASPYASLIDVNGTLYGTTWAGGANRMGTVFSITTGGKEQVLHSFAGSASDGANPYASLTGVSGKLYGTTTWGGTYKRGTFFALTP